jgi:hypothetical protein
MADLLAAAGEPSSSGQTGVGDHPSPPAPRGPRRWPGRSLFDRATGIVLAVFAVSRLAALLAGVRFDTEWVSTSWQIADTELLRNRLFETVWYGHSQPPVLNTAIGLALKYSPLSLTGTFFVIYTVLGVVLTIALVDLLRRLGTSRVTQVVVTSLVIVSPPVVLYGHWLSYEFPTAVGLVVIVDLLAAYVGRPKASTLAALMGVTTACILTRSLLHPALFLMVLAVARLARRPDSTRRAVILAVVLPGLVLSVFVVRNLVLWGQPSLSSWSGMNLAHAVLPGTSIDHRSELVAQGRLSPLALRRTFQDYDEYVSAVPPCVVEHPEVAEVARPKKGSGATNFDYECFLPVFDRYQDDALKSIWIDPAAYARQELFASYLFFGPSDRYDAVRGNQARLGPLNELYERLNLVVKVRPVVTSDPLFGKGLGDQGRPRFRLPVSLVAIATTFAVIGAAAVAAWRWARSGATTTRVVIAVIGGIVVFVMVFGNAFEVGENQRFRFLVEPLVWVVVGFLVDRAVRRRRAVRPSPG